MLTHPLSIIIAACLLGAAALGLYAAVQDAQGNHNALRKNGQSSPTEDSQEDSFTVSGSCLRDAHEKLQFSYLEDWIGGAAEISQTRNAAFTDLIAEMADTNTETDAVIQTQAQQVKDGKSILKNTVDQLVAAMPVAQDIYFSGPTGPAISYQFQLAVSSAGIGTTTNTVHTTHQNAQENGRRLDELAEKYDEMYSSLLQ